jgi:hypothetical protein
LNFEVLEISIIRYSYKTRFARLELLEISLNEGIYGRRKTTKKTRAD